MNSSLVTFVRKFVLTTSGLVFGTIAVIGVILPRAVARQYGFELAGVEAFNEFRAVYTGFWIGLAVAMITAARRTDVSLLGDCCALMLLLQALGRALSFALDGRPSWPFIAAFAAELSGGLLVLALRPSANASSLTARMAR